MGCFNSKSTEDVMLELRNLDNSLREMVYKYEIRLESTNNELKEKVAAKATKDRLIVLLRRRKILRSYLIQSESRMSLCTQKQCSLEQLEITRMQLQAIKSTSSIFKRFTKRHTVERVEQLQDTLCALQDDMMDISEILEQPLVGDLNVDDELEALMAESELPDLSDLPAPAESAESAVGYQVGSVSSMESGIAVAI